MTTEKIEKKHFDILGVEVKLGNYVAVPRNNVMKICKVIKLNPKMISVEVVSPGQSRFHSGFLVYSSQSVIIQGEDAIAYVLKHSK
jgi:hypothetical protein